MDRPRRDFYTCQAVKRTKRIALGIIAFVLLVLLVGVNVSRGQPVQERRFNSPEEAAAFVASLPPGSKIVESSVVTDQAASGKGAGLDARGKDIVTGHNAGAPNANLQGTGNADGGTTDIDTDITGGDGRTWWLIAAGVLCIGGAGYAVYKGNLRLAAIAGGTGLVLIAIGVKPAIAVYAVSVGAVGLVGYLIYREVKAKQDADRAAKSEADAKAKTEALRATVGGIAALKGVNPNAYEAVKAEVGKQADPADVAEIAKVKEADRL